MSDLISRQAAIDAFGLSEKTRKYGGDQSGYDTMMLYEIQDVIENLPSVTPQMKDEDVAKAFQFGLALGFAEKYDEMDKVLEEVKKAVTPQQKMGKWIGHREHCENLGVMPSGLGAYEWCSNCGCGIDVIEWHRNNYNFCPNCGAKMEVKENG